MPLLRKRTYVLTCPVVLSSHERRIDGHRLSPRKRILLIEPDGFLVVVGYGLRMELLFRIEG